MVEQLKILLNTIIASWHINPYVDNWNVDQNSEIDQPFCTDALLTLVCKDLGAIEIIIMMIVLPSSRQLKVVKTSQNTKYDDDKHKIINQLDVKRLSKDHSNSIIYNKDMQRNARHQSD